MSQSTQASSGGRRSKRIHSQSSLAAQGSKHASVTSSDSAEGETDREFKDITDRGSRKPMPAIHSPIRSRLKQAHKAVKDLGFKDISDCFLLLIQHQGWQDLRLGVPSVPEGWLARMLEVAREQRFLSAKSICADSELCAQFAEVSALVVHSEMTDLVQNPFMRKPVSAFTHDYLSKISFHQIGDTQKEVAPVASRILSAMIYPKYSTSAPAISSDPEGAASAENGASWTESEGEPVESSQRSSQRSERSDQSTTHRNRKLMRIMAMCLALYGRSQQANVMQGFIGYYLSATNAGKRVIESLHCLGVSVSYESVLAALSANAAAVREMLRRRVRLNPFFISFDNMVFYKSVKSHLMRNRHHQRHYTAGYIAFLVGTERQGLLPHQEMVNWGDAADLTISDIMVSAETLEYTRKAAASNIWSILYKHSKSAMCVQLIRRNKEGKVIHGVYERISAPEAFVLPVEKSDLHTLIAFNRNEAIINEVIEIISDILTELDLPPAELLDKVILFKGDYMTVRNILYESFKIPGADAMLTVFY